jgi:hypothetical protein
MVDYSSADFRRLTPTEHRRIGVSKSRRLYVLKDVAHVTELTPTISMNKYYNLKTREETGLASRHVATEARKHGRLPTGAHSLRKRQARSASVRLKSASASRLRRMLRPALAYARRTATGRSRPAGARRCAATG